MALDIVFPRMRSEQLLRTLDLARQFRTLESLDRSQLQALQWAQLRTLLKHAFKSDFWAQQFERVGLHPDLENFEFDDFLKLPHLRRKHLQDQFESLRAWPEGVGADAISLDATTGSTGQPVRVEKAYSLYTNLYAALMLVEQEWHQLDLNKPFGFYRHKTEDTDHARHGYPFSALGFTGVGFSRSIAHHPIERLYEPLLRTQTAQISGSPTLIRLLCEHALSQPQAKRPSLEVVNTLGERVTTELRSLVHDAFGARIIDRYSCGEVGLMALQCPKHEHYHVLSGAVLLEIVDDNDKPCGVGQPGNVLVTSLHSYAMPIIRYELGDVAQWGPPCDCGIHLPVIDKILGKSRDLVLLPNGRKHFVTLGGSFAHDVPALLEHQVRFYANNVIEFVYCARSALTDQEQKSLSDQLQERFGHPWPVVLKRVDAIEREGLWKRQEFIKVDQCLSL